MSAPEKTRQYVTGHKWGDRALGAFIGWGVLYVGSLWAYALANRP